MQAEDPITGLIVPNLDPAEVVGEGRLNAGEVGHRHELRGGRPPRWVHLQAGLKLTRDESGN